ncbi:MAG: hypothetical protein IJ234_08645 [Clostridia bacterium]|nr:hypothetical protein [Clostridia bacterium]
MAVIGRWNGHTFEVSPSLVRSFTDLTVKGSCETKTKNSKKQKYVVRKYGEIAEISMTLGLNALLGVNDVRSEAMQMISDSIEGAQDYFYVGDGKLLPCEVMLISASVEQIEVMPGDGGTWIRCDVKCSFKQASKNDEIATANTSSSKKKSSSSSKSKSTSGGSAASEKKEAQDRVTTLAGESKAEIRAKNTKTNDVVKSTVGSSTRYTTQR